MSVIFKIKVTENGPFVIEGDYNFFEETIVQKAILDRETSKIFQKKENLHLCRCGESASKPHCDGSHNRVGFNGKTTASHAPYMDRSKVFTGSEMDLLDDHRCALARFCHREHGSVWEIVREPELSPYTQEAVDGGMACPAGRLTAIVNGDVAEHEYDNELTIVQDPLKKVSAGIYARGDFELVDENNHSFEKRNRMALCRCGVSDNKPFCDATHNKIGFNDE